MTDRRPIIAGNWKMFGRRADLLEIDRLVARLGPGPWPVEVVVCPPFTLLAAAAERLATSGVGLGAQDVTPGGDGAKTGDVNAAMIADAGAGWVIVGHSERRAGHGETDAIVAEKAKAARAAGLMPIVCVGETLAEREAGQAEAVVAAQIAGSCPEANLVIAYEPVWAIGTGLTPTVAQIESIHAAARAAFAKLFGAEAAAKVRVLYGGSVKPGNAAEILAVPGVDGALVGGASLKADDFAAIIGAHSKV